MLRFRIMYLIPVMRCYAIYTTEREPHYVCSRLIKIIIQLIYVTKQIIMIISNLGKLTCLSSRKTLETDGPNWKNLCLLYSLQTRQVFMKGKNKG